MTREKSEHIKSKTRTFTALPPGHISVVLLSNSGLVPLANLSYRIRISSGRVLEGTTGQDGLISHPDIPLGEYRMELEGHVQEVIVPSLPTDEERQPLRVSGYMLFEDDASGESLPEYEESEEIELGEVDEEDWVELT